MTDASPPPGGPLSAEETEILAGLMARYLYHHLDQFEFWKMETADFDAYVWLSAGYPDWEQKPIEQIDWRFYTTVWPRPDTPARPGTGEGDGDPAAAAGR